MSNAISLSDDVLVVFSTYSCTMDVANGAGTSYPSPVSAVTQWVSLVKLELLTLQKHRFQPWLFSASWFSIFSFLCNVLWIMVFPFVSDLLAIVLCVLWFTTLMTLLYLIFWPLYCVSFDLRLPMTLLVSSNFSNYLQTHCENRLLLSTDTKWVHTFTIVRYESDNNVTDILIYL